MFEQRKRTCLSSVWRVVVTTAVVAFSFAVGVQQAVADIVPGTVSNDPFDSTQGTVVVDHDTIIDPINAFRTSGGFEDGHTLMRNGGLNSVSFINFDTPSCVSIIGVRLFAHNDEAGCCLRRAMNHFKLFADTDSDGVFETTVVDEAINPQYNYQPGNIATGWGDLDLTLLASGVIRSQHWRLEVTQGSNVQPYEGARLVELDAIPPLSLSIDIKPGSCPNPLNVKSKGALPVAIMGTQDFDVTQIDPSTLLLGLKNGDANGGVKPILWAFVDVGEPYEPYTGKEDCELDCATCSCPDGYDDLVLNFDRLEVIAALGEVYDGDCLVLELTGNLFDGSPIVGEDVVIILKKGK